MFNFGSKKEKKKGNGEKNRNSNHETTVVSRSLTSHITETRSVYTQQSSSTYSTRHETLNSTSLNATPNLLKSIGTTEGIKQIRSISLTEPVIPDARVIPFPGQSLNLPRMPTNYQSPFSRQLAPYNSERYSQRSNNVLSPTNLGTQTTQNNNNVSDLIPTYNTRGAKRGNVIVINNIKFLQSSEERKGAEIDEKDVSKLFKDMGFDVKIHRNLKVADIRDKVKRFSKDKSLARADISVVIIMSHGTNRMNDQVVPGSFTQIYGSDGNVIEIEDIVAYFSGDNCTHMKGKPKIFIFQCCRGDRTELKVDSVPIQNVVKRHADVLIAFSTLPGFFSLRDPSKGSWYIQSICDVFRKHAKDFDVEGLLKIVDGQLSKKHPDYKQTSTYESRGFKRCYLNPTAGF